MSVLERLQRRRWTWAVVVWLRRRYGPPVDLGAVMHQCVCGSELWKVLASFQEYEMAAYSTDMYCAFCGAYALTPTPGDRPEAGLAG